MTITSTRFIPSTIIITITTTATTTALPCVDRNNTNPDLIWIHAGDRL